MIKGRYEEVDKGTESDFPFQISTLPTYNLTRYNYNIYSLVFFVLER